MAQHRKDKPKRPRKPVKIGEVAVLIAALGTFLTGPAALLHALN
ncbi:hypothetical protein DEIPH_ctg064orf0042 [Deinococcus phoenicis]|uniref:Uncharacterized protein n=1 Tax=Deinococcus phoenicis TaxID=1476583 RepID=A0A016QL34_9DEIO|nr:hypothetical protein [Deinococcus phoenicis]EYB66875.1 hypothetical protein DEIPH_ctg064orf0042 [Deinococcus phoenicis]